MDACMSSIDQTFCELACNSYKVRPNYSHKISFISCASELFSTLFYLCDFS